MKWLTAPMSRMYTSIASAQTPPPQPEIDREALRANGIDFATPSVQVGGDEKGGTAAAANIVRAAEIKAQAAAGGA